MIYLEIASHNFLFCIIINVMCLAFKSQYLYRVSIHVIWKQPEQNMYFTLLRINSGDFQYYRYMDDTKHFVNILLLNMSFSKTIFSSNNLFSTAIYIISRIIIYIPNMCQIQVQLETSVYKFKYLQYKGFDRFSFEKRFTVHIFCRNNHNSEMLYLT